MIEQVMDAFAAALTIVNLLAIAGGVTLGIVIGAIPGLGSVTAMAVLIPVTYYMSPLAAVSKAGSAPTARASQTSPPMRSTVPNASAAMGLTRPVGRGRPRVRTMRASTSRSTH